MNRTVEEIENQTKRIEENIQYIKDNLSKVDGPIFIELMGSAKSGKTTLLKNIKALFEKKGIPIETKQETAEYNPVKNRDIEEYNIWMIMELMKQVSEDIGNSEARIVVYDRGILDRIPWIDYAVGDGSMSAKDSMLLKQLYQSDFVKRYQPLAYGFITSPELSVLRKGKEGKFVNRKSVAQFNEYFQKELGYIESIADSCKVIKTDPYQGQLKIFMMDVVEQMTEDIRNRIKELEFGTVGGETPGSSER